MLSRGEIKRIMREATRQRIRAERDAITEFFTTPSFQARPYRLEEDRMLDVLKKVPSVFAFAEQINSSYQRPDWASQRYGAN